MKMALNSLIIASLATISLTSFAAGDSGLRDFKDNNFIGNFSYMVRGAFNGPLGSGELTEVGLFKSNGKGEVTAQAIANIVSGDLSTALPSGDASYNCTYTDTQNSEKSSMILLHCVRHQANFIPQDQNLDLVLAVVKDTPIVKIQALSGGTFGTVQVAGEGSRAID
jgi:hypothetical protein